MSIAHQDEMISAASGALEHLFRLSGNDKILILTDSYSAVVADAFRQVSVKKGCTVEVFEIENSARPLSEIPPALEKMLPGKTVVLNIIKAYPEEMIPKAYIVSGIIGILLTTGFSRDVL